MAMNKKYSFIFIISIIIACVVFFYHASYKEIWFCDEVYSYTITNGNSIGLGVSSNTWVTQEQMLNLFRAEDGLQYLSVIKTTAGDVHPPIYYLVLKTVSVLLYKFDLVWIGLITNFIFYFIFLLLIFRFSMFYYKNFWLTLATIFFVIINRGVIGCELLIRMYFLVSLLLLAFMACTYYVCFKDNAYGYVAIGVITFSGFMTYYNFALYALAFSLVFCIWKLVEKKYLAVMKWMIAMVSSVVASTISFPWWLKHVFTTTKGKRYISKTFNFSNIWAEIRQAFEQPGVFLFGKYWMIYWVVAACVLLALAIIKAQSEEQVLLKKLIIFHITAQIVTQIVISHIYGSAQNRYFWPVAILQLITLCMALQFIVNSININNKKHIMGSIFASTLVLSLFLYNMSDTNIQYWGGESLREGRLLMESYSNVPWIYYGERGWAYLCAGFDFIIPDQIMFMNVNYSDDYDSIIATSDNFVLYVLNEEDLSVVLDKLSGISNKDYSYEYLLKRGLYCYVYYVSAY